MTYSPRSTKAFKPRTLVRAATTVAACIAMAATMAVPTPAAASDVTRLRGESRLATAATVALNTFPGGTRTAVLTNADSWTDTLAAAPLAGALHAAQLLTYPTSLDSTSASLEQLGVTEVVIVGTVQQISGTIETELAKKYKVTRIAPSTLSDGQYETASLLTQQLVLATGGSVGTPTPPKRGKSGLLPAAPKAGGQASPTSTVEATIKPLPRYDLTGSNTPASPSASPSPGHTPAPPAQAIGGPASYDTVALPNWTLTDNIANVNNRRTVLLASGEKFPDALAGSAAAAAHAIPVLYTEKGQLNPYTANALKALGVGDVIILGGTNTISATVETQVRNLGTGVTVSRLFGKDRVETAVKVAQWSVDKLGFKPTNVGVARADAFPDAMTAAQYNAKNMIPLVLTAAPDYLTAPSVDFVMNHCKATNRIVGFGGNAAVSEQVLTAMQSAADCVRPAKLPSNLPTSQPTQQPTHQPTQQPTQRPSEQPSQQPSAKPSDTPTKPVQPTEPYTPPTGAPVGAADPRTTLVRGTKFLMHPEINGKIDTTKSGMQDKVSTLTSLYVTGTRDGSPMPSTLDWAQFPCNKVFLDKDGVPVFTDADKDGFADGFGHSSNNGIEITGMNKLNVPNEKYMRDIKVIKGVSSAQLTSGITDCTWLAAFPKSKSRKIEVDANGRAKTPIGLGWARIANGPNPGDTTVVITNGNHQYDVKADKETAAPNTPIRLTVTRKDGAPVTARLTVATFPCSLVRTGSGDVLMTPSKANSGAAQGYGDTATNSAVVTKFNDNVVTDPRRLFMATPVNGKYVFDMTASKGDCTAVTVIKGNGNGIFDIDAARRPAEPFGVTTIQWK